MAKRMPLVEVGSHLDHALVLLAGVEPRARTAVRQPHPIQLTQMIPCSSAKPGEVTTTLQTPELQLTQLTCSNLLLHGKRIEGLQTRLEHNPQECETMLEKLKANAKEHAKQSDDIKWLKKRLQQFDEGSSSEPVLQVESSRLESHGANPASAAMFLTLMDMRHLRRVNRAQYLWHGPPYGSTNPNMAS